MGAESSRVSHRPDSHSLLFPSSSYSLFHNETSSSRKPSLTSSAQAGTHVSSKHYGPLLSVPLASYHLRCVLCVLLSLSLQLA